MGVGREGGGGGAIRDLCSGGGKSVYMKHIFCYL